MVYEDMGEYDKALACIDGYMLRIPDDYLLTHKARILNKAGKTDQANALYELILKKIESGIKGNPEATYRYFQKASLLKNIGRIDDALAHLNDFLMKKNLSASDKATIQERIDMLKEN